MEFKQISLADADIKFASDDSGSAFSGYASVFGGIDSYGDTIHPGAYKSAIGDGAEIKMYFNHGWMRKELPIGKMLVREDERGLFVERAEFTKGMKTADDVHLAVKHGTVNGLSVGIGVPNDGFVIKSSGKGRDIHKIALLKEVSCVDWPADRAAAIVDVRSALDDAVSIKEIESLLRDAGGFSRTDAKALLARIKSMCLRDADAEKQSSDLLAAIRAATIKITNGES